MNGQNRPLIKPKRRLVSNNEILLMVITKIQNTLQSILKRNIQCTRTFFFKYIKILLDKNLKLKKPTHFYEIQLTQ